jgi:uncharacterized repeat protein (TIGR03803 family)
MTVSQQSLIRKLALALTFLCLLVGAGSRPAQAQTFTVIHNFTGPDGANPVAGLTLDRGGNLYGTTEFGGRTGGGCGSLGCGTVFRLQHHPSGWILSQLLAFTGQTGNVGSTPQSSLTFGPDGALYGTTPGVAFSLRPPPTICGSISCPWQETVLFTTNFSTGRDLIGGVAFDSAGKLYGTAQVGVTDDNCFSGCGTVHQIAKSGGVWTETTLHQFVATDGYYPNSGVIVDAAGNLYGVAPQSYYGSGVAFEMTPSGSGWNFNPLYQFPADGSQGAGPWGGIIFSETGSLYGTTAGGTGATSGGSVFELAPAGGSWNYTLIHAFSGSGSLPGPWGKLLLDAAGNLYGTTLKDGAYGYGNVFRLSPSNGGWIYTSLHDFTGGSLGAYPYDGLVMDANGNLYGTTAAGGQTGAECYVEGNNQCGLVFEITP